MNNFGVFYVAAGKKYVDEACYSAQSLKKINPSFNISIACNLEPKQRELFDQIIPVEATVSCRNEGLLFKVKHLYSLSPYQQTLFVDTDTFFLGDCQRGFSLLKYFDIAMCLAPADTYYPHDASGNRVECKPLNTGVIFFNKNQTNQSLFQSWFDIYSHKLANMPNLRESDQTAFVEALLSSNSRLYPLPSEWNARFCFMNTFCEPVKILHGYSRSLDKIGELVNTNADKQRVWIPHWKKAIAFRPYTWRHHLGKIRDQIKSFSQK